MYRCRKYKGVDLLEDWKKKWKKKPLKYLNGRLDKPSLSEYNEKVLFMYLGS